MVTPQCNGCSSTALIDPEDAHNCAASCSSRPPADELTPLAQGGITPHHLLPGNATGPLLTTSTPLSFWGGVDATTGVVLDVTHPVRGACLAGKILALPRGRGSCSGSLTLLEILVAGTGPAALILEADDHILALGAVVANTVFGVGVPVVVLGAKRFAALLEADKGCGEVTVGDEGMSIRWADRKMYIPLALRPSDTLALSPEDERGLAGHRGQAVKEALEIVTAMARLYGADTLLDISQSHIDGVFYSGPAGLSFAQHFASLGARVAVPTTLNAITIDRARWEQLGTPVDLAANGEAMASAFLAMGANEHSLTCAPYLLPSVPGAGQDVGWGESNAVVYANSVLGARTQKYPDVLDLCMALSGRAPRAGAHLETNRRPTVAFRVSSSLAALAQREDLVWSLLGYHVGHAAGASIPIIFGLESTTPAPGDLKSLCAAFGTSSSAPMLHVAGITPEAHHYPADDAQEIRIDDLASAWRSLNSLTHDEISLVALGNPHFALDEFERLAALLPSQSLAAGTRLVITCGRGVLALAEAAGYAAVVRAFGGVVATDVCWCFVTRGVGGIVREEERGVLTSSAKYAHYGPGMVGVGMRVAGLAECVDAAVTGRVRGMPAWLADE